MKFAIIADDLTGANDSGVQFARFGLRSQVWFEPENTPLSEEVDVVILDSDSRSMSKSSSYKKVRDMAECLKRGSFDVFYKKIDSTMRGNIGGELDAVYDAFMPDFVIVAPAYPEMGRTVRGGHLYVNGRLVHETEVFRDPKTPVKQSFIPELIQNQTKRKVGHITLSELAESPVKLQQKLARFKEDQVPYLLFDSEHHEDLKRVVDVVSELPYMVVWVGSAGLATVLPAANGFEQKDLSLSINRSNSPVLLVAGSVSAVTRRQLEPVLADTHVSGIVMQSHLVVTSEHDQIVEINRVFDSAVQTMANGKTIVLFSSGSPQEVQMAMQAGVKRGLDSTQVSDLVATSLGKIACRLILQQGIERIILTGGDTAKRLLNELHVTEIDLLDEVEPGVPIGRIPVNEGIYAVTKAGSFGSDTVFLKALRRLQET